MDFLDNLLNTFTFGIYGKFQYKNFEIRKLNERIEELESTYKKASDISIRSLTSNEVKVRLKSYQDLTDKQKIFVQENDFIYKGEGIVCFLIGNGFQLSYPESTEIFNAYLQNDLFEFYEEKEEE